MKLIHFAKSDGIVLIITLVFLMILTLLSLVIAKSSIVELKMSGNLQTAQKSFQAAEAGVMATIALIGSAEDPFDGITAVQNPFDDWLNKPSSQHPLSKIISINSSVKVSLILTEQLSTCPRTSLGFSQKLIHCDFYNIKSTNVITDKTNTTVHQGLVRLLKKSK